MIDLFFLFFLISILSHLLIHFSFINIICCHCCCFQIAAATIANANVLLQIDNSKLAADDFKTK